LFTYVWYGIRPVNFNTYYGTVHSKDYCYGENCYGTNLDGFPMI